MLTAQLSDKRRNLSIVALNAVSTLSQIGQYGLGTTLLPIALVTKGATPEQIGITSSALWLGMLAGLLVTGQLIRALGYRITVILGLVISALSFAVMPWLDWQWWLIPAAAIGFGLGLRWIANETWLYRLAPAHARGRIIGIHETLISIAAILAPLIIVSVGAVKPTAFLMAATIIMLAIIPLFIAVTLSVTDSSQENNSNDSHLNLGKPIKQTIAFLMGFGALIAGLGGWMEGSILAFLPVYSADIGLASSDVAWLLTILGIGATTCQFAIGWLADNKGLLWTAKLCTFAAFLAVLIAIIFEKSFLNLAVSVFILGGVGGGLLTLGIFWATLADATATEASHAEVNLSNRVRQVSIIYTILSAAGPFVAGFVVSHAGSKSLFWQQLVVILMIAIVLFWQSRKNIASPL
ncbi:MFS transporter [Methylotenera versatilis]|uniref:Major facilitator superfamily MFS_1 n=1 Tax=Methylotenera versatilis (strain 301) TaxID=666681 RepID=D7DQ40_METV0|nr:MFS transporter [Methylotenera versatilis]ADI29411.1 major facilitator superfamily MFS_1 [Methylotenera versatilis 301]